MNSLSLESSDLVYHQRDSGPGRQNRLVGDDPLAGDVTSLASLALRKRSSHHQ